VAEEAVHDDRHERRVLPGERGGERPDLQHLLVRPGLEHRDEAGLEEVAGVDHVLRRARDEVRGDVEHEPAAPRRDPGRARHDVAGLEEAGHLHRDDRVLTRHRRAEAERDGVRLVHGPADAHPVLDEAEPLVDHLGRRRARVAVGGVDASPDAADGERDVALEDGDLALGGIHEPGHTVRGHGFRLLARFPVIVAPVSPARTRKGTNARSKPGCPERRCPDRMATHTEPRCRRAK
jgi:hypothetical protein